MRHDFMGSRECISVFVLSLAIFETDFQNVLQQYDMTRHIMTTDWALHEELYGMVHC